jgi:cation diffusion facilitator CzcD-associated flavoprotein CzcO
VALRRAGIDDLMIIEADHGVGGTWRRNTYPGAACDIQSHLYSFSFALNKSGAALRPSARDLGLPGGRWSTTSICVATSCSTPGSTPIRWNADTWRWDCQMQRAERPPPVR